MGRGALFVRTWRWFDTIGGEDKGGSQSSQDEDSGTRSRSKHAFAAEDAGKMWKRCGGWYSEQLLTRLGC